MLNLRNLGQPGCIKALRIMNRPDGFGSRRTPFACVLLNCNQFLTSEELEELKFTGLRPSLNLGVKIAKGSDRSRKLSGGFRHEK
jgi:hypothetical protein